MIELGIDWFLEKIWKFFKVRQEVKISQDRYLRFLINNNSKLGQDWVGADHDYLLSIEQAFVPVRLWSYTSNREESLKSVLGHIERDRLVIQGEPGAGKSTLSRFVTVLMARAAADPHKYQNVVRQELGCEPLFPLRVCLKDCEDSHQDVQTVMLSAVNKDNPAHVMDRLEHGTALAWFDGLDEVGDARRRARVMEEIRTITDRFCAPGKGNRFVVTTRPAGYNHRVLASGEYALYTLGELAPDQQEEMVRKYYRLWSDKKLPEDERSSWQARANQLVEELSRVPDSLKGNPLLLSLIIKLHFDRRKLLERRHELYGQCIGELVLRRDFPHYPENLEVERRINLLAHLAFALQQQRSEVIPRGELEKILTLTLHQHPELAGHKKSVDDILEEIAQRWGVLVAESYGGGGELHYSLMNPTFREYLAARAVHLSPEEYWPVLEGKLQDRWWEEVVTLYSAMIPRSARQTATPPLDQVIEQLIYVDAPVPNGAWIRAGRLLANEQDGQLSRFHSRIVRRLTEMAYGTSQESLSALEALSQIKPEGCDYLIRRILGRTGVTDQKEVMAQLQRMSDANARQGLRAVLLARLSEPPPLLYLDPERTRVLLAEALGQVGDTRLGQLIDVSTIISPGKKHSTKVGKYPVTNIEYARFVEDTQRQSYSPWKNHGYPLRWANHPATHISFQDAAAYCNWVGERMKKHCRLPTETEWTAIAKNGDLDSRFPWGLSEDQYVLNWRKNLDGTTPVGIYPEGDSKLGVSDLLGNVWEWTQDSVGDGQVLKGGAWDSMDLDDIGVDARLISPPGTVAGNIGFRIVVEE